MADHLNERHFVAQLDSLLMRAWQEQRRRQRESERCHSLLIAAQLALDKMEKLQDQSLDRHEAEVRQLDQRRMDELATNLYHWREH